VFQALLQNVPKNMVLADYLEAKNGRGSTALEEAKEVIENLREHAEDSTAAKDAAAREPLVLFYDGRVRIHNFQERGENTQPKKPAPETEVLR
jgi:hypothetical protein